MTEVLIKYNPYKLETSIVIDNKDLTMEGGLSRFRYERFQVWLDKLIPIMADEIINDTAFKIVFHGTTPDFEDLQEICDVYNAKNMKIELEHIPAKGTTDKIEALQELVDHMKKGPFEALKDEKIEENFHKAINSEFEIGVIATMSSGKSTLINALLGKELMPSKNEACTATIVEIKNIDGKEGFEGACYDGDDNIIMEMQPITKEDMKVYNEKEDISTIKVEGDITNIHSHKMNLVLVDTPGPNNSRNEEHRNHTYRVIKNEAQPMVLYVLNATALSTDDDNSLLTTVANQMRVGGKQSKDRFIFAVNKVDCIDPEQGEDLEGILSNVKKYLQDHGIENPNIFPVSAEVAKVIRMEQNGELLTRKQRKALQNYDLFTDEPSMHLNQYHALSPSLKKEVEDKIAEAKQAGDAYTEALYHSGVPAIEASINEYLEKYAITSKISNAVDKFKKIIEDQQMMQQLEAELEQDEQTRIKIHEEMKVMEKDIEQGEKAKKLKDNIRNLDMNVMEDMERVQGKINKELTDISNQFDSSKVKRHQANGIIKNATTKVESLQSDVLTDLEKAIQHSITESAEKFVEEYKSYVKEIVDVTSLDHIKLDKVKLFTTNLPSAGDLIDKHSFTSREVVGTKTVKNESKKWYKPWTWLQDKYYEEDVYGNVEYVDSKKLLGEFIMPVRKSLEENLTRAMKHMEEEKTKLKHFFLQEIHHLEEILLEKVREIKELSQNDATLSKRIAENEEKKAWLDNLVVYLDEILEV